MAYSVEEDPNQTTTYDALKIAAILGLDKGIIESALESLGEVNGE